jgi:methionine aminopeptidase
LVVDIIGWAGSVFVLLAYGLLSAHKLTAKSRFYQVLNIAGSICLIINTVVYHAYPSTFVNIVWLGIAAIALFNIYKSGNGNNTR